jgi:polyhydroxybutyrate depolymerase
MGLRLFVLIAGFAATLAVGPCRADERMVTMQVGGAARTYLLELPRATEPRPTLIFLHGSGADGLKTARTSGLDRLGPSLGFVTVFPNAIEVWNLFPNGEAESSVANRRGGEEALGDDIGFIKALVADLVRRGVSDPHRIFLAGISYGGLMTLKMACTAPEMFVAIGIIYSSMPAAGSETCHPSKPLPFMAINGTADPVLPYAGGPTIAGFTVWATDRTVAFFRNLNGCTDAIQSSKLPHRGGPYGTNVVVQRWSQCAGGPVTLYQIVGGGHGVFGSLKGDIDAYSTLATFFRDQNALIQ